MDIEDFLTVGAIEGMSRRALSGGQDTGGSEPVSLTADVFGLGQVVGRGVPTPVLPQLHEGAVEGHLRGQQEGNDAAAVALVKINPGFLRAAFCDVEVEARPVQVAALPSRPALSVAFRLVNAWKPARQGSGAEERLGGRGPASATPREEGLQVGCVALSQPLGKDRIGRDEAPKHEAQHQGQPVDHVDLQDVCVLVDEEGPQPVLMIVQRRAGVGRNRVQDDGVEGGGACVAVGAIRWIDEHHLSSFQGLPLKIGGEQRMNFLCDMSHLDSELAFALMKVNVEVGCLERLPAQARVERAGLSARRGEHDREEDDRAQELAGENAE